MTPGRHLTKTLCRYFRINGKTRNIRDGIDVRKHLRKAIIEAATIPGYYLPETEAGLRIGFAVVLAWDKHVEGYRIDGQLAMRLRGSLKSLHSSVFNDFVRE